MPRFNIHDFRVDAATLEQSSSIATLSAASGRDALALYSISQGFSDPRNPDTFQDDQDWFHFDAERDEWTMTFTNTTLIAIAVPS